MNTETQQRAKSTTINNVKYLYRGHWFDRDTMRFFNSRVSDYAIQVGTKYYFVSSEKHDSDPRRYTIRMFDSTEPSSIETVGEFQKYSRLSTAEKALYKLVGW